MASRTDLQTLLENTLGSSNVYFQPPPGFQLSYPCIIYSRNDIDTRHADNSPYSLTKQYRVTVIDADPDSPIPEAIASLPRVAFDRAFKSADLNHDVFTINF